MNGDQLQVGLDISQKRLDVCTMRANGEVLLNHRSFANNRHGYEALKQTLLEQVSDHGFAGLDIGAESTGYYWLPLFLQLQADESWQEHEPTLYLLNSRQVYWFKKGYAPDDKSDARDSFYVTEKLRTQPGRQYPWTVEPSWLRLRFYSRLRFHLGQALTREKNYFWSHMFLMCSSYRAGQPFGDGLGATGRTLVREYPDWQELAQLPAETLREQLAAWSHNRLPDVAESVQKLRQTVAASYRLPAELQTAVHHLLTLTLDHITFLEKAAAQVERYLEQEVNEYHPEVNHLVQIKGLGIILAAGIGAEIGDLQRFFAGQKWDRRRKRFRPKNLRDVEDAVAKHAGLWWPRNSSGDFEGDERRLSKKGNRFLRYYLVEAADKLRQYQPEYQAYYARKYRETKKHQHKRALVLTARKSVGLFVGLLHRNEPYRPQEV
jgi:transposase